MKSLLRVICYTIVLNSLIWISDAVAEDQAGVVLTFDDTYVNQWHDYFSQENMSDIRATFFVSHWHTLSAAEVEQLRQLEAAGHEVGSHTYSHRGVAGDYNFDPNRINEYLNDEIIPSLINMQADGFNPVSFSYPSGERNETYDAAVRQYFPYLRTTFADENKLLFQMDEIYHSSNSNYGVLAGDGIDNSYDNPIQEIEGALMRAKTNNELVTLYAHRILPDDSSEANHNYGIRVSKLNQVINLARQMGLKFYTFREAWEIGNNGSTGTGGSGTGTTGSDGVEISYIEGNRVGLKWTNVNADFIGIVPAGQEQWQSGMPGADISGSSGKLGINIPASNADQQYVAIFYSASQQVANSATFTINGSGGGTGPIDPVDPVDPVDPIDPVDPPPTGGSDTVSIAYIEGNRVGLQWTGVNTDFVGIVPVGQAQWQTGMPGANISGTSGKIGINVSASGNQQYVAIFYNGTQQVASSAAFTMGGSGGSGITEPVDPTPVDPVQPNPGSVGSDSSLQISYIEGQRVGLVWSDTVNDFIGIIPASQSEWQNGMPGAFTDGSASGKVGITVTGASGQSYKAVAYSGGQLVATSDSFTIN